jgi:Domain of unknown function (DUF4380)
LGVSEGKPGFTPDRSRRLLMSMRRISELAIVAWLAAGASRPAARFGRASAAPQNPSERGCRIEANTFEGWPAQQMTNRWLKLTLAPELGGRLIQVSFAGHLFLFVNPKYRGHYFPPSEDTRQWFNYGGDKIWPLPEGSEDDQHWPGPMSDVLDDGDYAFHVVSQGAQCAVRLDGPPDPRTGLEYSREITIASDSPEISFQATMKNAAIHPIRWSVQSVTQYDTADPANAAAYNHDFWAFTPANAQSSYVDGFHVRSGLAEDPSYSLKNGMFSLHWLDLQGEVWIDSTAGWLAVVDGSSQFALVERFHFDPAAEYPGKATVIFYKNGPAVELDAQGQAAIRTSADDAPFYMEAELNSPMVRLAPGESYTFHTEWFPTRMGSDCKAATAAGVIGEPLRASLTSGGVKVVGTFGVFFPGQLAARFFDKQGTEMATTPLGGVDPSRMVKLDREIEAPRTAERVSLRLTTSEGMDRGSLGEAEILRRAGGS